MLHRGHLALLEWGRVFRRMEGEGGRSRRSPGVLLCATLFFMVEGSECFEYVLRSRLGFIGDKSKCGSVYFTPKSPTLFLHLNPLPAHQILVKEH